MQMLRWINILRTLRLFVVIWGRYSRMSQLRKVYSRITRLAKYTVYFDQTIQKDVTTATMIGVCCPGGNISNTKKKHGFILLWKCFAHKLDLIRSSVRECIFTLFHLFIAITLPSATCPTEHSVTIFQSSLPTSGYKSHESNVPNGKAYFRMLWYYATVCNEVAGGHVHNDYSWLYSTLCRNAYETYLQATIVLTFHPNILDDSR